MKEIVGRTYGGGSGPIKTEGVDIGQIVVLDPEKVAQKDIAAFEESVGAIAQSELYIVTSIAETKPTKQLDEIVFDILNLTKGEREAVYEAVIDLVEKRLEKAKSVKNTKP